MSYYYGLVVIPWNNPMKLIFSLKCHAGIGPTKINLKLRRNRRHKSLESCPFSDFSWAVKNVCILFFPFVNEFPVMSKNYLLNKEYAFTGMLSQVCFPKSFNYVIRLHFAISAPCSTRDSLPLYLHYIDKVHCFMNTILFDTYNEIH